MKKIVDEDVAASMTPDQRNPVAIRWGFEAESGWCQNVADGKKVSLALQPLEKTVSNVDKLTALGLCAMAAMTLPIP